MSASATKGNLLTLPVLPLAEGVVVPQMVVTIALETPESQAAADEALATEGPLLLVPRVNGRYASVGVTAVIETSGELPNGQRALVVRATARARLGAGVAGPLPGTALWLHAEPVEDGPPTERTRELAREYRATVENLLERIGAARAVQALRAVYDRDDPGALADTLNEWPDLSFERRLELLETLDVEERLTKTIAWVRHELAELELKEKIRHEVGAGMEKQQREFLLRQQLVAIRKELGEGDASADAATDYRVRLESKNPPDAVRVAVEREIDRLERMSEQSVEQTWIRNWLDIVLDVPWDVRSTDRLDVVAARAVLDADTTGLDDAKDRIVEWLAVRKLRADRSARREHTADGPPFENVIEPTGPVLSTDDPLTSAVATPRRGNGAILLLAGPPGVGKTSLGESVARALGRRFTRVALGGIRDEAEIRGHRRTYVGAQAGRIVRALREAGTMNPVVLLDEVDKLAAGWSGDPGAALLEVLDPAQNHTFRDHYLEVDLDLSDVIFLATANTLDSISGPLLDRMELITVDGYTDDEKVAIASNHLLPRQLAQHGLAETDVAVGADALRLIVEGYTREAGVRGLERELGKLLRKAAVRIAAGEPGPILIDSEAAVTSVLGRPRRVLEEVATRTAEPGVAIGLAVTGAGGDVLFVEATSMPVGGDDTSLTVTGQLGDVMKESASIALSYVRANAGRFGIDPAVFAGKRIHIHFPAGAVPKDGPSAGVTMTTALVSLLTGRAVKSTVAMTGEVTLQGRVLPIGGVKQKLLAAHRAGITTVIIPQRNEPDLDDVPESVRAALSVHPMADVADVVLLALEPAG